MNEEAAVICERCRARGPELNVKRGYELVSWVLFYAFMAAPLLLWTVPALDGPASCPTITVLLSAWLAHFVFRFATAKKVCPSCGTPKTMIPAESPQGQKLQREFPPALAEETPTPPVRRWWLRAVAVLIPLAALAATAVWNVHFDPAPKQRCYRFARNVVRRETGGDHPDSVQQVVRLSDDTEAAEEKMASACISGATTIRETKGRAAYVEFIDCAGEADSQDSLVLCLGHAAEAKPQ